MDNELRQSLCYRMKDAVVQHSQFNKAFAALEKQHFANTKHGYVDGLYITGSTNIGKTFIKNQFLANHRPYDTEDRTIIPVLSFSMPTAGDGKGLYQSALAAMHSRYLCGTETATGLRFFELLKACKTKLMIVDEAQHFVQRNGSKGQERAADNLKNVMNEGISVVLMGTNILRNLMKVNEQLRRRFSTKIKLREWDPNNENDIEEVGRVVATILSQSSVELDYEEILDPAFIQRLIFGTGGRIGFIIKLMVEAALHAKENHQKEFRRRNFEEVFTQVIWDEVPNGANPFSKNFHPGKLTVPNNPFMVEV